MHEFQPSDYVDSLLSAGPVTVLMTGMPADRQARVAARRAFVDMKRLFMRAVQDLSDRKGEWLREKVRLAIDPMDLWLLRGPVLSALQRNDEATRRLRAELYRGLDQIFPGAFGLGPHAALNTRPPEPWELGSALHTSAASLGR